MIHTTLLFLGELVKAQAARRINMESSWYNADVMQINFRSEREGEKKATSRVECSVV